MNNEPVAWMEADVLPLTHIIKAVVRREQDEQHTIPLYTHPADAEKVKENMDKVLKQNERLIEALANARITFDAEIEKKNTMLKMWEVTHPAKTQSHTETAVKILNYLGYAQEPSKEEGADARRDKLVEIISQSHPAKTLTDEEMMQIADETLGDSFDYDIMWLRMFVQAILRKAQEK